MFPGCAGHNYLQVSKRFDVALSSSASSLQLVAKHGEVDCYNCDIIHNFIFCCFCLRMCDFCADQLRRKSVHCSFCLFYLFIFLCAFVLNNSSSKKTLADSKR